MKNKWKSILICFLMAAVVLLEPVSYVRADEGTYSKDVPYLEGIEFNMLVNMESNRSFGQDLAMQDKDVSSFIFKFDKLDGIKYENYEVVFDFVLKSQLPEGQISTHDYSVSFDIEDCKPGILDDFRMFWKNLFSKNDIYQVSFDFDTLVQKSPDCIVEEKWVSDGLNYTVKKINIFNTVISQVDCYLREKSTGNIGFISRFILTWDSDFYKALCTNITYNLVVPEVEEVLDSGSISNSSGSYGYDSDGDNAVYQAKSVLSSIFKFFTDLPAAIVAFLLGFMDFTDSLKELILVVFPFIPPGFVIVLMLMFALVLIIALYKLVQGWFG